MTVSELIAILNTFEEDSDVVIYSDSTDVSYDINCIDIDENDGIENNSHVIIFI